MDNLFQETLAMMERTFAILEEQVPPPRLEPFSDDYVYRYAEKSPHQAILQKLARVVSGLHAARILLEHGFFQEQASLQRMLDEFQEDIIFLYFGLTMDEMPARHQEYLAAFYEEEFDNQESAFESTQKRPMISRKKIRADIANIASKIEGTDIDPSSSVELFRTNSKAYSGFVHGASPQIMSMCAGDPPKFHVSGMLGTPREEEYRADLCNYFYRGLSSFAYIAKLFGKETLSSEISKYLGEFARQAGMG